MDWKNKDSEAKEKAKVRVKVRVKVMDAFKDHTVLVTGGAGFLGSNIVNRLIGCGKKIIVLDDLFTGNASAIPQHPDVEFVQGSVCDSHLLGEIMAEVDSVFHFAARNILLSMEQPSSDFLVNGVGTQQILLEAMRRKGNIQKIVYASTSSIYGNPERLPAIEKAHDVSTPYAASKMSGELLCRAYAKAFHIPVTALRFSNVFGPGQLSTNPYCGVVSKLMDRYVLGKPFVIYGDGTQTRDFTYVEDAMDAVFAVAATEESNGQVYNIGTGVETRINDLAQLLGEVVGSPDYPIEYKEKRSIDTIYRRSVSIDKLQALTGWKPTHSLKQGISKTWEWFKA